MLHVCSTATPCLVTTMRQCNGNICRALKAWAVCPTLRTQNHEPTLRTQHCTATPSTCNQAGPAHNSRQFNARAAGSSSSWSSCYPQATSLKAQTKLVIQQLPSSPPATTPSSWLGLLAWPLIITVCLSTPLVIPAHRQHHHMIGSAIGIHDAQFGLQDPGGAHSCCTAHRQQQHVVLALRAVPGTETALRPFAINKPLTRPQLSR
jgi:hypothetical protein